MFLYILASWVKTRYAILKEKSRHFTQFRYLPPREAAFEIGRAFDRNVFGDGDALVLYLPQPRLQFLYERPIAFQRDWRSAIEEICIRELGFSIALFDLKETDKSYLHIERLEPKKDTPLKFGEVKISTSKPCVVSSPFVTPKINNKTRQYVLIAPHQAHIIIGPHPPRRPTKTEESMSPHQWMAVMTDLQHETQNVSELEFSDDVWPEGAIFIVAGRETELMVV